jgi:mRNA interferase RelE/StbE
LPKDVLVTAASRLAELADEPRPRQSTKMRGLPPRWRIRFGKYRATYTVSDRERRVIVLRVGHRTEVYE